MTYLKLIQSILENVGSKITPEAIEAARTDIATFVYICSFSDEIAPQEVKDKIKNLREEIRTLPYSEQLIKIWDSFLFYSSKKTTAEDLEYTAFMFFTILNQIIEENGN